MPSTGSNLCTANGVTPGSVTQTVCVNTPDACEVYIKKGSENGVSNIKTCRQYCKAYGMACAAQYDDNNGCGRGSMNSCDDEGGASSDHICQCDKGSSTGMGPSAGVLLVPEAHGVVVFRADARPRL